MNKKILFYVNDGFAIRYLLRSTIYSNLIKTQNTIIIVSHNAEEPYFKKKFTNKNVILESCNFEDYSKFNRKYKLIRIIKLFRSFILNGKYNTQTIDDFREIFIYQNGWFLKNGLWKAIIGNLWRFFSFIFMKYKSLRLMLIELEKILFTPNIHSAIFKKHKPDLAVVSALCGFEFNEFFAREAKKNNCKVCTIILSWDNTSGMGYPGYRPDHVITWTKTMKKELIELNDIKHKFISIGGVAHFDNYFLNKTFSKVELFESLNLDVEKKTIFYATKSPRRFPWGPDIVRFIADSIESGKFDYDTQLLVRIHPLHYRKSKTGDFEKILEEYNILEKKYKNVVINRPKLPSKRINFDMDDEEMKLTASILKHSDVMINMFSTMILEASIFDLPSINICLKDEFRGDELKTRQDIMVEHRQTHSRRVYKTGGAVNAYSFSELIKLINNYLNNKQLHSDKRAIIVNNEVGDFRGNSGKNISKILVELAG